jgi:hypothetical protein
MAKKHKFTPTNESADIMNETDLPRTETTTDAAAPAETKSGLNLVKKPQIKLIGADGTEFQFTRFTMIKKAAKTPGGDFQINLDGNDLPAWSTSSKGWAADDASIDYIWATLPDGTTGYITLDYNKAASDYDGHQFVTGEGKASRADPVRTPRKPDVEEARKQKFKEAMAAKAAAAPTTEPSADPQDPSTTEAAA